MSRREPSEAIQKIVRLSELLEEAPKRAYFEPWEDWDDNETGKPTTGGQPNACVYVLLAEKKDTTPLYVGETVNLGKRLWEHAQPKNTWSKKWKYVQYISEPELDNGDFRLLLESFLIYVLNPTDNNPKRKS